MPASRVATAQIYLGFGMDRDKNSESDMQFGPLELNRRLALAAAERSGMREGLPPVSDFARLIAASYAAGVLSAEEAIAEIVAHYVEKIR